MDYGYRILERRAAELGKCDEALESADKEYRRILNGQDRKTAQAAGFQQLAALAAIETHLLPAAFGK